MIDYNELRTGNYVNALIFSNEPEVKVVTPIYLCLLEQDASGCFPIPLTAEILDNNLQKGVLSDYAFGGHAFKFRKGILALADNENYSRSSEKKYVHELQNLIYALTNKEIEIKL